MRQKHSQSATWRRAGVVLLAGCALALGLPWPASSEPALGPVDWTPAAQNKAQVHIEIENANPVQRGVIGDLVASVLGANGKQHFVSPKAAGGWVVVKAVVETPGVTFDDAFQWDCDGGEAVGVDRWRFPRDEAHKWTAKVAYNPGGGEAARMYVWIVWADAGAHVGVHDGCRQHAGEPSDCGYGRPAP